MHPWYGAELKLLHISVLDDQINLAATLRVASVPGEFPPNWCWFCGGACGLWVAHECRLQAISGTPAAGMCRRASGGKVWVCKSAIPNLIPLGFCPGSWFYRSLLSRARLPRPHCRRQRDGVELDFFFFFFFQICIAKSRTP